MKKYRVLFAFALIPALLLSCVLDAMRQERNFQMSGEEDDDSVYL